MTQLGYAYSDTSPSNRDTDMLKESDILYESQCEGAFIIENAKYYKILVNMTTHSVRKGLISKKLSNAWDRAKELCDAKAGMSAYSKR